MRHDTLVVWIVIILSLGIVAAAAAAVAVVFHTRVWVKPKGVLSLVKWLLSLLVFLTMFVSVIVALAACGFVFGPGDDRTVALIQQQDRVFPYRWSTVAVVCGYGNSELDFNEEGAKSWLRIEDHFRSSASDSELQNEYGTAGPPKMRVKVVAISERDLRKVRDLLKFPEPKP